MTIIPLLFFAQSERDQARTALEVHQMVTLQTSLGPERTAGFEAFLTYEIVR